MTDEQATVLASFVKRAGAEVRIAARSFQGYDLIDLRVFAEDGRGGFLPTKQGICLRREQFPLLIAHALKVVESLGLELPNVDEGGDPNDGTA